MKKVLTLFFKSLAWFLGILLALLLVAVSLLYLYKDKIIDLTVNEINKYLNTRVEIDPRIDFSIIDKFPQVYIQFHNVKVYESVPKSNALLGELRSIYVTFDVLKIWKGEYSINHIYLEHGYVHLKVDAQGNNNYNIIKSDTSSKGGGDGVNFHLNRIELNDVSIRYENLLTRQDHQLEARSCVASLHAEKEQYRIGLKGDLHVHAIHLNSADYFTQKDVKLESDMLYSVPDSSFRILPSSLKVQDANFNIQGRYEFSHRNSVDLSISAGQSNINTLISLMPERMEQSLREYKSQGQVYFDAEIHGIISDTENPKVDINFGFSRASIYHPTIPYRIEYAHMKGLFTNGEQRNINTWTLQLDSLSGYLAGKKFAGNFYMKNFDHPFVKFDLETTQDVKSVLAFYPIKSISEASGEISAKIHFEGNLEDLQDKEKQENIISSGQIVLNNVGFTLQGYSYPFSGFRGVFVFEKNDISVVDFLGKAGQSDFKLNGTFRNVLAKLIYDKGQTVINATLDCDYVNASELLKGGEESDTAASRPITLIPEGYAFDLKTTIGQLDYQDFTARKLTGQLQYRSQVLKFTEFKCQVAGGKMALDSRLDFTTHNLIRTSTTADFSDIRVDSIFYMFDEFSQTFLTSENLRGQFTGKVQLLLHMDHHLTIDTKSIVAEIEANIRNGQLIDFGPMQAISKFIDEKELSNVKFSELKNKIYIKDEVITIPEMEIHSNVSNIRISGTHTFANVMDYKIAIPLKNFKLSKFSFSKKDSDAAIEEKSGGGATVYLTLKGTSEDYKVALDKERTVAKIKQDLNKEGKEFKDAFKKQDQEIKDVQLNEDEYFDFE